MLCDFIIVECKGCRGGVCYLVCYLVWDLCFLSIEFNGGWYSLERVREYLFNCV